MRILPEQSLFVVIDVQERLTPHIAAYEQVIKRITRLVQGMQSLSLPIILNEQYKKGLGETVEPLKTLLESAETFEKVTFSAVDDNDTFAHIKTHNRPNIILAGIETHVCIMQTALDLLAADYQPIIVCDAVGSRFQIDHDTALKRLAQAGVIMTTSESILFELCRSSKSPAFKSISALVK